MGQQLTRRSLLGTALAGGAALAAPQITRALAASPAGDVFDMALRGRAPVRAPRAFELVGLEFGDAPRGHVQLRTRPDDGPWTPWVDVHAAHSARVTDPIWVGDARWLDVRGSRSLPPARAHFVKAAPVGRAAALREVDTNLAAGPGQPRIIARSSWATRACRPREAAYYGAVKVAFVHHTVSANYYRASQSAAMVRSICLFHLYVHRWNDIGYNFVVDRYGQIFEGRLGGIDEPLSGAHAGGYNLSSTGIAMLGTFSGAAPARRAMDALEHLLAWKLSLHGIPAAGRTTVEVSKAGQVYSRYRAGTPVSLHRVAGHRDGDTTECPGYVLYRRLPSVRRTARRMQGPISNLGAQFIPPGAVSGVLTSDDAPVANAQVEVQRRTRAGHETLALATTAADGTWSAGLQLTRNAALRALYRGAPGISAVVSPPVFASVPTQIALQSSSGQTAVGIPVQFSGTVSPPKDRVTLVVTQLQPDGTYLEVRNIRVAVNEDGTFSRGVAFSPAGRYQVLAHTAADRANAIGTSNSVYVTVV